MMWWELSQRKSIPSCVVGVCVWFFTPAYILNKYINK